MLWWHHLRTCFWPLAKSVTRRTDQSHTLALPRRNDKVHVFVCFLFFLLFTSCYYLLLKNQPLPILNTSKRPGNGASPCLTCVLKESDQRKTNPHKKIKIKTKVVMVHAGGTERQKSREEVGLEVEVRGGAGGGGGTRLPGIPKESCQLQEEPLLKRLNGVQSSCSGECYSVHSHGLLQRKGRETGC